MKKILFFISLFLFVSVVKAEKFTIGEYVSGEYVRMVSPEKTKNLNIQIIRNSNSDFVYCIEPFVLVDETKEDYVIYKKDFSGYKDLTSDQLRKISLIAFYGWGYKDRMPERWYAITQMLIWKTANPEDEFYFTDTKGGNVIEKYTWEMKEILNDVIRHDSDPEFIKDFVVNYKDTLFIDGYTNDFNVVSSDYEYVYESSKYRLRIDDVKKNGKISFERNQYVYFNDVTLYSSNDSQDLIKPGIVMNKIYDVNVDVTKGGLMLDIRSDTSGIYSSESDFTNTCYEIRNSNELIETVCSGNRGLIYSSKALPYGEYTIKQISTGKGYEVDDKVYNITIDGEDYNSLILRNNIIRNKIELTKFYCYKEECMKEENAVFNVYDINDRLVDSITTNEDGYGSLEVGYGKYIIVQDQGLDNYTFVDVYEEEVTNAEERLYKELYNYFIEEDTSGFDNVLDKDEDIELSETENKEEDTIFPPTTEEEELPEVVLPVLPDVEIEDSEVSLLPDEIDKKEEVEEKTEDLDLNEKITQEFEMSEVEEEIVEEEIMVPPITGTKLAGIIKILYNIIMIVVCCCIIKKFCYNN